ncbi:MAG: FAD-binding protein [Terriglobia bacterium]
MRLDRSPAALQAASRDFGRIHEAEPWAVLLPETGNHVAEGVQWVVAKGLTVSARGRGHNGSGYAQADGGLVVDTRTLARVHEVTPEYVDVDTGCDWDTVLASTLPLGLRPPVLPSHQRLSVGGVLSVGGIGEATFRYGTVGNSVISFDLVTGAGETLTCSRDLHADLFAGCLGGFGQFGIITRARIRLVPVPPLQRVVRMLYSDAGAYTADFSRLMDSGQKVEGIMGSAIPNTRPWLQRAMGPVSKAIWLRPAEFPWVMALEVRYQPGFEDELGDLAYLPGARYVQECAGFIDFEPVPSNADAHNIWLHLMIPVSNAPRFLEYVFRTLDTDPETDGPITVYPIVPGAIQPTAFQAPTGENLMLFDLMPVIGLDDGARLERVMECLRRTDEFASSLGGMCYPVGGLRYSSADWKRHFGSRWPQLLALKKRYDPDLRFGRAVSMFEPSDFN